MCSKENLNSKVERLENKKSMLNEQFDLMAKKIQFLSLQKIKESKAEVIFSLENTIKENQETNNNLEQEIEKIEQQIEYLKNQRNGLQKNENAQRDNTDYERMEVKKLHEALLNLNFTKQVTLFREFIEVYSVGAWIIHGEEYYGQRWLLNRLMELINVKIKTPAKVIPIGLSDLSYSKREKAIWYEVGKEFGLKTESPPNKVIDAVRQGWQTKSVIFIFNKVHMIPKELIPTLVNNFWTQLVEAYQNSKSSHKLLMFLVDEGGCIEKEKEWNQLFITMTTLTDNSFQNHWKPHLPIKLPLIQKISCPDLTQWTDNHINWLSLSLLNRDEFGIQSLLDNCQGGLPQLVLEAICEECNHNWYDTEKIWLKY